MVELDISSFRNQLDCIDAELVELLNRRMNISLQIGQYKAARSLPVFDAGREQTILRRVGERSAPELSEYVINVYRAILDESKRIQQF